jgi:hypothetical protein
MSSSSEGMRDTAEDIAGMHPLMKCSGCGRLVDTEAPKCEVCGQFWKTQRPEYEIELIEIGAARLEAMRTRAKLISMELGETAIVAAGDLLVRTSKGSSQSQLDAATAAAAALKAVANSTANLLLETAKSWEPVVEAASAQLSFVQARDIFAEVDTVMGETAQAVAKALRDLATMTVLVVDAGLSVENTDQ